MDLRIERTKKNIINAFIELRSKKPLEKITVKELSELALINKATFYTHYKDIYDLSEQLEDEILERIMQNIPHPEELITNPRRATETLALASFSQKKMIDILFSDSRSSNLIFKWEAKIKECIYAVYPEYQKNSEMNIKLTYLIQGGFHVFLNYSKDNDFQDLIDIISDICEKLLT